MFVNSSIDPNLLVSLVAGAAAMLSVFAFYVFFSADFEKRKLSRRLGMVRDQRAALRDNRISTGANAQQKLAFMKRAVESFKMEDLLSDPALKLKLAQAGRRGRSEVIKFLFMRIAAPPVLGGGAFLYLYFLLRPEGWNTPQYALASIAAALLGYYLPGIILQNQKQKRQTNIMKAYPDALDLLTICVESGMSIDQSFNRVSEEIGGSSLALAEELQLTTAELAYLGNRKQAYENLGLRTDLQMVKAIVSSLIQAESHGTPIGQALRVISQEGREERMNKAEQKAAALPAKMTVPMIVFFLPALFVMLLGPAILKIPG